MPNYLPTDYIPAKTWLEQGRGGDLIPTRASLDWFIRENREELLTSGELLAVRGKTGSKLGPNFDQLVVEIFQRKSRATA